jgi:D-methionine transport system substrate-binding protein
MLLKITRLILAITLNCNVFASEVIKIAASSIPHAEILNQVKPILKRQGIDLQIREFNDYVQPNLLVEQGQLDANFFQHSQYLEQFNFERHTNLVRLVAVHLEPMGIYMSDTPRLKTFMHTRDVTKGLPNNLIVGVPNDQTNEGRALLLLEKNGFIKIKAGLKYSTKLDIILNPHNIAIKELDSAMLPRAIRSKQLDFAVINANYALQASLNPIKDAVFLEDANNPYVNIVAVDKKALSLPKMQKLKAALNSDIIRNFIKRKYKNTIVPAF